MINPWIIVGFVIALAVVGFAGERVGERLNDQAWQKREAALNADAANKIAAADAKTLAAEHTRAADINNVSARYEDQLTEKKNALASALASARTTGLFIHTGCATTTGDHMPNPSASPGGRDGGTQTKLPDTDSSFLLAIASEADGVAVQLGACQSLLKADRK